jgi:hypothetical protein
MSLCCIEAVLPSSQDMVTTPCLPEDRAEIGGAILPANAVVDLKKSGVAGHSKYFSPSAP